ncbi:hypothetical protein [Streptomyces dangxiongensis]|uniref:hypothetical protein n=1 Tax=Streptomyces dangxiongensis TaxID=1442032 RepID=UPI0013CEC3AF|nr:hypothetical protein [Streptomyces dangxiongensis]
MSTGTATAATRPTVGHSDVDRLRVLLAELWLLDDQNGGGPVLERRAADLAARTLSLQQHGSASQRVRSRLYAVAASFTAFAMFSAIDARRLGEAQRYLEQSVTLAGLSGDGQVQHQTWRYAAMLAGQRGRYADALAAAEACTGTRAHRTDPFYASLTHSRIALTAASLGDKTRALRALDRAHGAYDRADPAEVRPSSVAFYTRGELHGLTGITHYRLGEAEKAEFHAHRLRTSATTSTATAPTTCPRRPSHRSRRATSSRPWPPPPASSLRPAPTRAGSPISWAASPPHSTRRPPSPPSPASGTTAPVRPEPSRDKEHHARPGDHPSPLRP